MFYTLFSIFVTLFFVVNAQTPNCSAWCDTMFSAAFTTTCGSNGDFDPTNPSSCYNFCSQLNMPAGNAGAISGNSIACRQNYANQAAGGSASACAAASISGGNVCGGFCESYCMVVLNGTCNATYPLGWSQCMQTCATFPTTGTSIGLFSSSNWANNVQCRTYHAGTPANSPGGSFHCAHATAHGGGSFCVNQTIAPDYCTGYCQLFTVSCAGQYLPAYLAEAPYSSTTTLQACIQYCNLYGPLSSSYFTANNWVPSLCVGDTIDCRTYHSVLALSDPTTHCPHASLDGDNVCGQECGVYCNLATNPLCTSSQISFGSSTCASTCANYADGTVGATTGNTLQCRIYHLSYALVEPNPHCGHGTTQGPCVTSPPPPATPPPSPPSGTNSGSFFSGSLVILLLGFASFM